MAWYDVLLHLVEVILIVLLSQPRDTVSIHDGQVTVGGSYLDSCPGWYPELERSRKGARSADAGDRNLRIRTQQVVRRPSTPAGVVVVSHQIVGLAELVGRYVAR